MTTIRLESVRLRNMEKFGLGPNAMKKIKKCPKCGEASPAENNFCVKCGSRLPNTTMYDFYKSLHRICPECETVLSDKALYCPHCGTEICITNKPEKEDKSWDS